MPGIIAQPAAKAPFAKRQLRRFQDFSGGLNDKVSPLLIEDNEVAAIQNMNYLEKGTVQKRHGYTKRYASTFATGPVRGLWNYRKEDGTSRLVIAADDKLFYDTPQFVKLYDVQTEWEAATAAFSGVTSGITAGDIVLTPALTGVLGSMVMGGTSAALAYTPTQTRSGTWVSDAINISAVTNQTSGVVTLAQTVPSGTSVTIETRTSADASTWSAYAALGAGNTIQSPGNTYLQVRSTLAATSVYAGSSVQSLQITYDTTATVTQLTTGLSTIARYCFVTQKDVLYIVNGVNANKKWDATTLSDQGGAPPIGKYALVHKERMFIAGASAARSRLYYSDVGNPESWPVLNFIDIGSGDGDTITGLAILNDRLIVTKDNSVWELAGDSSANFLLRKVTGEGGAMVMQSMALIKDTLAWIGKDGVRLFDGVRSALGSEKIVTAFAGLNSRQLAQASGVFWGPEQHYFLAAPEGASTTNNVVLVFDALRTAWTIYRGIPAGEWCVFRQYNKDTLVFGSATTGQVYEMSTTNYSDDGAAIDAYVTTKAAALAGGIEAPSLVPDVFVACSEPASTATTISVSFIKDTGSESSAASASLAAQALNVLRVIPSTVGVSLPRSLAVKVRNNVVDVGLKINAIDIRFSGKGLRAT